MKRVSDRLSTERALRSYVQHGTEYKSSFTPRSHYLRQSTDGGFRTYPCVFPGSITKEISLDSALPYICITRSYWLTDLSLPEKLNFSQLLDARDGAALTDGPTMHFKIGHVKSMRSVR